MSTASSPCSASSPQTSCKSTRAAWTCLSGWDIGREELHGPKVLRCLLAAGGVPLEIEIELQRRYHRNAFKNLLPQEDPFVAWLKHLYIGARFGRLETSRVCQVRGIAVPINLGSVVPSHRRSPPGSGGPGESKGTLLVARKLSHIPLDLGKRQESEISLGPLAAPTPNGGPVLEQAFRSGEFQARVGFLGP